MDNDDFSSAGAVVDFTCQLVFNDVASLVTNLTSYASVPVAGDADAFAVVYVHAASAFKVNVTCPPQLGLVATSALTVTTTGSLSGTGILDLP
jgi:hypothetical protein